MHVLTPRRTDDATPVSIIRYTLEDIMLANGARVPAHTFVTGTATSTHRDEALFRDAAAFAPRRFADGDSERGGRRHYVSTSPADIGFGCGKHAWCVGLSSPVRASGVP